MRTPSPARHLPAILAALLLAACASAAPPASAPAPQSDGFATAFSVIQLNDVYRIDAVESGAAGGLGRVATLAAQTRQQSGRPVLLLHAGDFIAPSLESRYFAGLQMIDALNFLHARTPLLVVPGNHEFDDKRVQMFADAVRASRFPWLAANLELNTGDVAVDRRVSRDTVMEVGGLRVGVFALTLIDAPRDYAVVDTAVVAVARRHIRALEERGADAIVALTHLELDDDRRIARLRREHPRFLWIAGGHEHYLIEDTLTDSTALITKGDSNARRVWRVALGRRDGEVELRAEPVAVDASVAEDADYRREIEARYRAELLEKVPFFDAVIGRAAVRLDGTETTVRDAESNWGNWLTDRMRTAYPDVPADVAVLNGGAIRVDDGIDGDIRWEHLQRTFGFPTRVGLVWLSGKDLKERVLERSVSGGRGEGRFLQVSGVRFAFDRNLPVGQRVSEVEIQDGSGWAPLDERRVYVVAMPDYIFGGGDGYDFKAQAVRTIPPGPDLKLIAFDALMQAYASGEPIAPRVEGRIRELGAPAQ